jgi:hypothetical protein
VVVSWHLKYIIRLSRIRVFNAVNLRAGYPEPEIRSFLGSFMKKTESLDAVRSMLTGRDVMSQEVEGLTSRQQVEYIEKRPGLKRPAKGVGGTSGPAREKFTSLPLVRCGQQ